MRSKLLTVAIAAGLGLTSFSALAATPKSQQPTRVTIDAATLQQLQAQLAALQSQVADLQAKQEAQADAQVETAKAVNDAQVAATDAAAASKKSSDKIAYKGVNITLGGFLAAESIYRTHQEGADIASNYNSIPYKNTPAGHLSEGRFSARQSRISMLAQGDISPDTHVAGYIEADFLGGAQTANQNESNSFNPRERNVYMTIDWDKPGLHLLAGQNWSLLTLNTKGITPRTEAAPPQIDAQYVPGFSWARQPQIRLVKDWNKEYWLGISLENPQTTFYVSPNQAKAPVTSIYNTAAGSGYDSANTLSVNHIPDVIVKFAADPGFGHYEIFGIGRAFYNRYNSGSGPSNHDVYGGGFGVGMILPVVEKFLDFQFSGMQGRGIGRYGSAQLPDVTFKPNGSIAPIKENMVLAGLTLHANPDMDIYLLGGREHEDAKAFSYNGVPLGYGNAAYSNAGCDIEGGACVGNTKQIYQGTLGFWWKFYQGKFGKAQFGAQYSHTVRDSFEGVGGSAKAKEDMVFTSFRYYPF
jgi:hypothetical protein